ncbi:MAG TPA: hypothetical protein VM658_04945 [bacterium]|nr:hypothetical protein [bacterium]
MSRTDRVKAVAARGGLFLVRAMVLYLPDRVIARIVGLLVWAAWVLTGDGNVRNTGAEIVDIFASGPPFTATVRKLMRAAEPEIVVSAVLCQTRPSPYGSM